MVISAENTERRRGPGRPAGEGGEGGRAALLRAARDLMAERGLPQLTSREVAERADVKPTLVNYYFGNREGLLRTIVEEFSVEMQEQLGAASCIDGPATDRLQALMEVMIESLVRNPYGPRLLFEQVIFRDDETVDEFVEAYGRSHFDAIRSILRDGRDEGALRDIDSDIALAAIGGICVFLSLASPLLKRLTHLGDMDSKTAREIAGQATDLLLHGLAAGSEEDV
jgi:TetR/AcrR family transcriptional regulator